MLQRLKRQFQPPTCVGIDEKIKIIALLYSLSFVIFFRSRNFYISILGRFNQRSILSLRLGSRAHKPCHPSYVNCTRSNHTHSLVKYDKCWDSPPYPPPQISPQTILGREERSVSRFSWYSLCLDLKAFTSHLSSQPEASLDLSTGRSRSGYPK